MKPSIQKPVVRDVFMEQTTLVPALPEESFSSKARLDLTSEVISTELVHAPSLLYHAMKRLLDITLSAIGILVLMPVFLAIAICIKLDDGGKVLHFREIIGYQGRRFYALKFRTMIPDADTYLAKHPELMRKFQQNMKLERDPRITDRNSTR